MSNLLNLFKGKLASFKQKAGELKDSFLMASEKLRTKGYNSLNDNEVKGYIQKFQQFAKENPLNNEESANEFATNLQNKVYGAIEKVPVMKSSVQIPATLKRVPVNIDAKPVLNAAASMFVGERGVTAKPYSKMTPKEQNDYMLQTAMGIGSIAPVKVDIQKLTKLALHSSKNQTDAIKRISTIVDKALDTSDPQIFQKLKTLRSSLSKTLFEVTGAPGTGNYKNDYAAFQKARENPEVTKLIDFVEAQVIRVDDQIKNMTQSAIEKTDSSKAPLEGLLTESSAMTKFRRSGNLKPQDVYKGKSIPVELYEREINRSNIPPKFKANMLDYIRTPENVLKKFGLEKEGDVLRQAFESYRSELRNEQKRILSWYKRVPDKASSKEIFKYLDGDVTGRSLSEKEMAVATEMKDYLKTWAKRLGLPEEKQVSSYITHLFEKGQIEQEFDPELAKIIDNEIAGSVWNPFTQRRTDAPKYKQDVWAALDAYTKRSVRDVNMSPALEVVKKASEGLDLASWKYMKKYTDHINMRPSEFDELLDNLIKASPIGYKATGRPTAHLTRKFRNVVYRGALGLNIGSAMKNLTQGANTYAVLGEKYTAVGYAKLVKNMVTNNLDELYRYNILDDNIIQDREVYAVKKALQKMDEGLWVFFDTAEKINRGSAYWGAKSKALSQGKSESEAIEFAKKIVRQTQFTFGSIDTPVALQGDLAKLFTQFMSYPVKQTEFLAGLAKNKDFLGLIRYASASLFLTASVGKLFGLELKNFVPFSDGRFTSPAGELFNSARTLLSDSEQEKEKASRNLQGLVPMVIPGGAQLKKSLQGSISASRGYSATKSGRVRYPVNKNPGSALRAFLFGQNALPEAREYYGKNRTPLGPKQSELFKLLGRPYYDQIMSGRATK